MCTRVSASEIEVSSNPGVSTSTMALSSVSESNLVARYMSILDLVDDNAWFTGISFSVSGPKTVDIN